MAQLCFVSMGATVHDYILEVFMLTTSPEPGWATKPGLMAADSISLTGDLDKTRPLR